MKPFSLPTAHLTRQEGLMARGKSCWCFNQQLIHNLMSIIIFSRPENWWEIEICHLKWGRDAYVRDVRPGTKFCLFVVRILTKDFIFLNKSIIPLWKTCKINVFPDYLSGQLNIFSYFGILWYNLKFYQIFIWTEGGLFWCFLIFLSTALSFSCNVGFYGNIWKIQDQIENNFTKMNGICVWPTISSSNFQRMCV